MKSTVTGQNETKSTRQAMCGYGRTLAFVYRAPDGLFVNLEIIRQGYGHAYTKYPFDAKQMELFRLYEKAARESGRGLWGSAEPIDGKDTKGDPRKDAPPDTKSTGDPKKESPTKGEPQRDPPQKDPPKKDSPKKDPPNKNPRNEAALLAPSPKERK